MASRTTNPDTSSSMTLFSAADAAIGYVFQIRFALLQALRRLRTDQIFSVYLETLDDIVFQPDGDTPDLLQVKHHNDNAANLSDASPDLWKTLRVWMEGRKSGLIPHDAQLFLVTTAAVSVDSAASQLQVIDRDEGSALKRLALTAKSSQNATNQPAYRLFRDLSEDDRAALISSITIFPGTPNIIDVDAELRREIRLSVRYEHCQSFISRLEGWWYDRSVKHLRDPAKNSISSAELDFKITDLRDQFHHEALPIDGDLFDDEVNISSFADYYFVQQLHISSVNNRRIALAVRDYYRAFEQRSRWVREELVQVGELGRYERQLKEAWEIVFFQMQDDLGEEAAEEACQLAARQIYKWAEDANFPIRPKVTEPSLTRGSLHMLADRIEIGWHPQFRDRLKNLLQPQATA